MSGGAHQTPKLGEVVKSESLQQFNSFWNKSGNVKDCVFFFQRLQPHVFYSAHGKDCNLISSLFPKHTLHVETYGGLPGCTLSALQFEEFAVDLLLNHRKSVQVLRQGSAKGTSAWEVVQKGSPGNLQDFEDYVLSDVLKDTPVVCALTVETVEGRPRVSCAYCIPTLLRFGFASFSDNERFNLLETLLLQINARECILPAVSSKKGAASPNADDDCGSPKAQGSQGEESPGMISVITNLNVHVVRLPKAEFNKGTALAELDSLLADSIAIIGESLDGPSNKGVEQSFSAVLSYLRLTSDEANYKQFSIKRVNPKDFMKLDGSSHTALYLFPQNSDGEVNVTVQQSTSLFGILNKCCTNMGRRTLRQWIAQPLTDEAKITHRLNFVSLFVDNAVLTSSLRDEVLKGVPDLDALIRKMQRRKSKLEDTALLQSVLQITPKLVTILGQYDGQFAEELYTEFLGPLEDIQQHLVNLNTLIQSTVLQEGSLYLIHPNFDETLLTLQQQRLSLEMKINKEYKNIITALDLNERTCKMERVQNNQFICKVTKAMKSKLSSQDYIIQTDTKTGMTFVSRKLEMINKDYSDVMASYFKRQMDLEKKFVETVNSYTPLLSELSEIFTLLDVYVSLSSVAVDAATPYTRPHVLPKEARVLKLVKARHPMLESQRMYVGDACIPNDIDMSGEPGSGCCGIITGPNMGGKSTFMRTVGLIQLMAQIGSFVPCESATLSVKDAIYSRLGATDYLVRGVSTFMAEMIETSTILSNCTPNSLIMIDEIGRGTSTYDGYGLAYSILESLLQRNAFTLFATHFHELTAMSKDYERIQNLHVTALTTPTTITMLYQVKPGICSRSFGIHVAEVTRFPTDVIECARKKSAEIEYYQVDDPNVVSQRKRQKLDRVATLRHLSALKYAVSDGLKLKVACDEIARGLVDHSH